eukprot:485005-Prymnesium_polylepis.2
MSEACECATPLPPRSAPSLGLHAALRAAPPTLDSHPTLSTHSLHDGHPTHHRGTSLAHREELLVGRIAAEEVEPNLLGAGKGRR